MENIINVKIKAILFDLGGVLFIKRDNIQTNETVDKIDQMIGGCENDLKLITTIKDEFGINDKELDQIAEKVAQKFEPNVEIWHAIPDLAKNYKLVVINNGSSLALPYFKKQAPIDKYFPLFLCSGQLGFKKPDPKIYQLALKQLDCSADECLFIDDLQENIDGANAIGINGLLWTKNSLINDITNILEMPQD